MLHVRLLGLRKKKTIKIAEIRKNTTDIDVATTNTALATTDLVPNYSCLVYGYSYYYTRSLGSKIE